MKAEGKLRKKHQISSVNVCHGFICNPLYCWILSLYLGPKNNKKSQLQLIFYRMVYLGSLT